MKISDKLELLRTINQLTKSSFCEQIGISRMYYNRLISGKEEVNIADNTSVINSICYLFNINKNWLLDDNNEDLNIFNDKKITQQIIDNYMLLSDDCKNIVDNLIDGLLKIQVKNNADKSNNTIPTTLAASSSETRDADSNDTDNSTPVLLDSVPKK